MFLALYLVCLLLVVARRPFWLDEILELQLIKGHSVAQIAGLVTQNRGGAPLDYLLRIAFVNSFGFSRFVARCPSILCSLLAAGVLALQGRVMKLRFPLLPALILCVIPIQLRYAVEARPYEPALCIMIFGTVMVLSNLDQPRFIRSALLTVIATVALLTQPFAFFPFIGYAVWAMLAGLRPRRIVFVSIWLPLFIAVMLSVPWWIWSNQHAQVIGGDTTRYPLDVRSLAVLVRELTGGGYVGTALILGCATAGFVVKKRSASFWLGGIVSAISLALATDAVAQYFFSIRQILFAIPGLCILAGYGLDYIWQRRPAFAACLGFVLFGWFTYSDARFFFGPREDWGAAAASAQQFALAGACVMFSPAASQDLFAFFEPNLLNRRCHDGGATRVVVASSPYGPVKGPAVSIFAGFAKVFSKDFHGPRIEVYEGR